MPSWFCMAEEVAFLQGCKRKVHGILQIRILDSLSLPQGIFPTQELNAGLLHCRPILYQLNHKGSPGILKWVACPFSSRSSRPWNWTQVSCIAGGFFTNWGIGEAWKRRYNEPYTKLAEMVSRQRQFKGSRQVWEEQRSWNMGGRWKWRSRTYKQASGRILTFCFSWNGEPWRAVSRGLAWSDLKSQLQPDFSFQLLCHPLK